MISKFKLYKIGGLTLKEQVLEWAKKDILILNTKENSTHIIIMSDGRLISIDSGGTNFDFYTDELEHTQSKLLSIMKIFKLNYKYRDVDNLIKSMRNTSKLTPVWERKKPKYTIE